MGASVDASSAMIESTVVEVAEVEDPGTDAIILGRTVGRANLARAPGGSRLVRSALRETPVFLHCLYPREGTKIITRMRGLGDSRSLVPSRAS